ncbi:MAG: aminotransferase class I/II-fold pyridoxal phosphate-dependent enzyme [Kiritimatiellae bacterium]|nr:aminotransferase class I/II-fold pyridoxal phosphate-dependent enzyme [Kiritimatiellia bacterium]
MNTNDSKCPRKIIAKNLHDLPRSGIRDFFDVVSSMHDVISLGVGEPGFDTPWHIREASVFALEKGATGYTPNLGLLKLREACSAYVKKTFQIDYSPKEEIIITVGVSEALDLAIRALVDPGDEVLYHEPCYVSYAPVIRLAYGKPVPIPTQKEDHFRLTRDQLEEKVTSKSKILILNFPTNPTGATLPSKDLADIAAFICKHNLIVITDEIYAELSYEEPHVSIASFPGMKERTLFLHGFSKAWAMTGFRLGYACAPPEIIEAMMKIHQYTMLCAPILSQEAAYEALQKAETDIAAMRDAYRKHRNFMCASFQKMNLPYAEPQGAFYAFPNIKDLECSSQEFALKLLEKEKVAVVPGSAFGASGEGYIRCSFATSLDDLKEAMVRIARFLARR